MSDPDLTYCSDLDRLLGQGWNFNLAALGGLAVGQRKQLVAVMEEAGTPPAAMETLLQPLDVGIDWACAVLGRATGIDGYRAKLESDAETGTEILRARLPEDLSKMTSSDVGAAMAEAAIVAGIEVHD